MIRALWVVGLIVAAVAVVNTKADRDSSGAVVDEGHVLGHEDPSRRSASSTSRSESFQLMVSHTMQQSGTAKRRTPTSHLGDGTFPGQAEVDRLAEGGRVPRFEELTSVPPTIESELDVFFCVLSRTRGRRLCATCMVSGRWVEQRAHSRAPTAESVAGAANCAE